MKIRDITIEYPFGTYRFDEENHVHTLNGKNLYGVTTVLKVIGKGDALVQWSANQAVEFIKENSYQNDTQYLIDKATLDKAKTAWKGTRDKAGNWGTIIHNNLEATIKGEPLEPMTPEQQVAFDHAVKWLEGKKILESERHLCSPSMWIGGICDLVYEVDGKKYLADFKTSSGIYDTFFIQMGAYDLCLKEMKLYDDIEGYTIVNITKDGRFQEKTLFNTEENRKAFQSALQLFKLLEVNKKLV